HRRHACDGAAEQSPNRQGPEYNEQQVKAGAERSVRMQDVPNRQEEFDERLDEDGNLVLDESTDVLGLALALDLSGHEQSGGLAAIFVTGPEPQLAVRLGLLVRDQLVGLCRGTFIVRLCLLILANLLDGRSLVLVFVQIIFDFEVLIEIRRNVGSIDLDLSATGDL